MADSSNNQMRSPGRVLWIWIALLALCSLWTLLISGAFPPAWYERRAQRQKVKERVQTGGGWEVLRRECIAWAGTNEMFRWLRRATNAPTLPPAIMALQPQQVYYVSPKNLTRVPGEPQIPIVQIKIFGMHSTGGHSTPYLGLEVVATPSKEDYTPNASRGVRGSAHSDYRKVSEGVYEIF